MQMRKVTKTHPPKVFQDWLRENKDLDCCYTALKGTPAHIALKAHLIAEQGYLCAYTGRTISDTGSHVEHVKPQNECEGLEDVEYRNMLACFPIDGGDVTYGYGASVKGGKWDIEKFISPCSQDCERRFLFTWNGRIKPAAEDDRSAQYTISLIQLDNDALADMRRGAIKGIFGFGRGSTELSKAEAERLLLSIDTPDGSGKLRPFCFVLKQLLTKYIRA